MGISVVQLKGKKFWADSVRALLSESLQFQGEMNISLHFTVPGALITGENSIFHEFINI